MNRMINDLIRGKSLPFVLLGSMAIFPAPIKPSPGSQPAAKFPTTQAHPSAAPSGPSTPAPKPASASPTQQHPVPNPASASPTQTVAAVPASSIQDSAAAPYRGSAFDYERKVPAYVEEHLEVFSKGKRTTSRTNFLGDNGKLFAQRDLNFSRNDFKPDYLYKDLRNGYEEGAEVGATDIRVHFRDSAHTEVHEKRIQVPEPCIINGGVGEFVRQHWSEIMAGKKVGFNMVIPARLDFFRFVAYIDHQYVLSPEEAKGRAYQPVVIEPKSSMLAMLLPVIVMYENPANQRLVAYQGIVNVADAKGRSLRVRTTYPGEGP